MPRSSTYNAVKFRVVRAEQAWREALDLVRGAGGRIILFSPGKSSALGRRRVIRKQRTIL
jgi:hypothetical protein